MFPSSKSPSPPSTRRRGCHRGLRSGGGGAPCPSAALSTTPKTSVVILYVLGKAFISLCPDVARFMSVSTDRHPSSLPRSSRAPLPPSISYPIPAGARGPCVRQSKDLPVFGPLNYVRTGTQDPGVPSCLESAGGDGVSRRNSGQGRGASRGGGERCGEGLESKERRVGAG